MSGSIVSSLSWDYHANYICDKANIKVLGLILRTFGANNSEEVSAVRPILEYGCQVWNPYLVKHNSISEPLESVADKRKNILKDLGS